mmetsp:Transcript_1925/g.7057  ORF Transcript_1925/g.7057 Transcript_1925/m.7057 type:complete len:466 (+) Transcript_1925:92-1489(+)
MMQRISFSRARSELGHERFAVVLGRIHRHHQRHPRRLAPVGVSGWDGGFAVVVVVAAAAAAVGSSELGHERLALVLRERPHRHHHRHPRGLAPVSGGSSAVSGGARVFPVPVRVRRCGVVGGAGVVGGEAAGGGENLGPLAVRSGAGVDEPELAPERKGGLHPRHGPGSAQERLDRRRRLGKLAAREERPPAPLACDGGALHEPKRGARAEHAADRLNQRRRGPGHGEEADVAAALDGALPDRLARDGGAVAPEAVALHGSLPDGLAPDDGCALLQEALAPLDGAVPRLDLHHLLHHCRVAHRLKFDERARLFDEHLGEPELPRRDARPLPLVRGCDARLDEHLLAALVRVRLGEVQPGLAKDDPEARCERFLLVAVRVPRAAYLDRLHHRLAHELLRHHIVHEEAPPQALIRLDAPHVPALPLVQHRHQARELLAEPERNRGFLLCVAPAAAAAAPALRARRCS